MTSQLATLRAEAQPDGWTVIRHADSAAGIALDAPLKEIWDLAQAGTLTDTHFPNHLAANAARIFEAAGLLPTVSPPPTPAPPVTPTTTVSAVLVQHTPQADWRLCLQALTQQGYPYLSSVTLLTPEEPEAAPKGVTVLSCTRESMLEKLTDHLDTTTSDAVLLLDAAIHLRLGALAEMLFALTLRADIAAVAPRVMWHEWPGFVAHAGDWRTPQNPNCNPYAGILDVGAWERWRETPAITLSAGLLNVAAWRKIGARSQSYAWDWRGPEWSYRARLHDYHILTALQAVAEGPWMRSAKDALSKNPFPKAVAEDAPPSLPLPAPGAQLYQGMPALSLDNVRGLYGPLATPTRPQIVMLGPVTPRREQLVQELQTVGHVDWISALDAPNATLAQICTAADLVIATSEALLHHDFLHDCPRPLWADVQPPPTWQERSGGVEQSLAAQMEQFAAKPPRWLHAVDSLLCASAEERLYWWGQLAAADRMNPYTMMADPGARQLVMVVPTTASPVSDPAPENLPEFPDGEPLILWCGGFQPWDDPELCLHAIQRARATHPELKLVYATFTDAHTDVKLWRKTRAYAQERGLDETVLFWDALSPTQRSAVLDSAAVCVGCAAEIAAACLYEPAAWADMMRAAPPLVVTANHYAAGVVARYALGAVTPPGDASALAAALLTCLDTTRAVYQQRWGSFAAAQAAERRASNLAERARVPTYALDRQIERLHFAQMTKPSTPMRALPGKLWRLWQQHGIRGAWRAVHQYTRWKLRRIIE